MSKVIYVRLIACLMVGMTMTVPQTHATEVMIVERGTEGLAAVPFRVRNETGRPLVCAAAMAHWYSADVGTIPPGGSFEARLWSKPASGEVFLLNAGEDRMPIQTLWCGYQGADVSTRSLVALHRRAGVVEPAVDLTCRQEAGGASLDCRRGGTE